MPRFNSISCLDLPVGFMYDHVRWILLDFACSICIIVWSQNSTVVAWWVEVALVKCM
jgi:hypothetical protein